MKPEIDPGAGRSLTVALRGQRINAAMKGKAGELDASGDANSLSSTCV